MGDATTRQTTKAASYPSANHPNYLETYTVQMQLPKVTAPYPEPAPSPSP